MRARTTMSNLALFLSLLGLYLNFASGQVVTKEMAKQFAQAFLLKEQNAPPQVLTKYDKKIVMNKKTIGFTLDEITIIEDNNDVALAYAQKLNPQGFIIISADNTEEPVLGFSLESTLSEQNGNQFLDFVRADIKARKKAGLGTLVNPNRTASVTQWGPWLTTQWQQSGRWNNKCPYLVPHVPGVRRLVGCVATATAQIVNYWQYPNSIFFSDNDYFKISGDEYSLHNASAYGIPALAELQNALSLISFNGDENEEAYLSFGIGVKLHMNYGLAGSGAFTSSVGQILRNIGYGSAIANTQSNAWYSLGPYIIDNLKAGWPIQIAIHNSSDPNKGGHSIVVDGYRDDGDYFHVNYGWGANSPDEITNTWYNIPVNLPYYDAVHTVVYNISPYQGWSQYGADERKSFSSPYAAPENPVREKWHVTCADDYSFGGLIVGKGNIIVASCSPNNQDQGNPPSVWFIDQYGSKIDEVVLVDEDGNLTDPVQSPDGNVYVGTGDGGIYKIDAKTMSATKIFQESSNEQFFDPPTADKQGNIYFSTLYTLYCLSPNGSERWHFTSPNGGYILRGAPAVDSERDYVYISHYDPNTKTPYLRCMNKNTGSLVAEKTFPTVTFASHAAGIVSLDSDGTIYVGSYTTLYALNPDATLSEKWSRNFPSSLMASLAPVVGRNGKVYVKHWTGSEGGWELVLAALDADNGNTVWSKSFSNPEGDDDIHQSYVASNNVIVFPYHSENGNDPDTWDVGAYKDNGLSGAFLWDKSFGTDGGELAFGPGTVYVIPATGYGHTITAISDGAEGDPESGGMSFTNNTAPNSISYSTPSDKAENQDTSDVQLSWSCSDPDGHSLKYDVYVCALTDSQEAAFVPVAKQISENSYTLTSLRKGTKYLWSVVASDGQAISQGHVWSFTTDSAAVIDNVPNVSVPTTFTLSQNYPNPFNPSTEIQFGLSSRSAVLLKIFNTLGQEIETLVEGEYEAGTYSVDWEAKDLPSGVYFYRLQAGQFVETKKMLLLK